MQGFCVLSPALPTVSPPGALPAPHLLPPRRVYTPGLVSQTHPHLHTDFAYYMCAGSHPKSWTLWKPQLPEGHRSQPTDVDTYSASLSLAC